MRSVVSMVKYEQMSGFCQYCLQALPPYLIFSLETLRQDNLDRFIGLNTKIHSKCYIPALSSLLSVLLVLPS